MILADDARSKVRLEREQCSELVAHHRADGNAGPAGDHFADDRRIDRHAHQRRLALHHVERRLQRRQLDAQRRRIDRRRLRRRGHRRLELLPQRTDFLDQRAFRLPARFHRRQLLRRHRTVRFDRRQSLRMIHTHGRFTPQHALLHFKILQHATRILDRRRRRTLPKRQPRARRVEHADGLVRQLTIRQVAMRQTHGGFQPVVRDAHRVMLLEARHHAAQHQHARHFTRLVHLHQLKAPRQRRVLLEKLLVLAPRRRRDRAQLTACERGLEQVRGVVLASCTARTDHRVRFVDEQDDRHR